MTRVKAIILISLISLLGMCLNLLLFSINASVVLDDLVDSLVKVVARQYGCIFFLGVVAKIFDKLKTNSYN